MAHGRELNSLTALNYVKFTHRISRQSRVPALNPNYDIQSEVFKIK